MMDCDEDNITDHTCSNPNKNFWIISSENGCKREGDDAVCKVKNRGGKNLSCILTLSIVDWQCANRPKIWKISETYLKSYCRFYSNGKYLVITNSIPGDLWQTSEVQGVVDSLTFARSFYKKQYFLFEICWVQMSSN